MCHAKSWFKRDGRPIPQWTRPSVTPVGARIGLQLLRSRVLAMAVLNSIHNLCPDAAVRPATGPSGSPFAAIA